jgi:formate dehydrogenase maturation protein FdhE
MYGEYMKQIVCSHCGETENLHWNYVYDDTAAVQRIIGVESILCNECGNFTEIEELE